MHNLKNKLIHILFLVIVFPLFLISCNPEVITYTVTFMNGGNIYHTATVIAGQTVGEITAPQAEEGKEFSFWSADENSRFNFNSPISSNITLHAVWADLTYEVTFYVDDSIYETRTVSYGKTISELPTNPSMEGKEFSYWAIDGENQYDFTTPVTEDLKLYAVWNDITHTIIFMNGDIELDRLTIVHGEIIDEPSEPIEEGKKFKWWSANGTDKYEFSTPVTEDLILYSVWDEVEYTVTFYVNNAVYKTEKVKYGQQVTLPVEPETSDENQVFWYWSYEDKEYDFSLPTTSDLSLYAVFTSSTHKVIFSNGEWSYEITVDHNSCVPELEAPENKYETIKFLCWSLDDDPESPYDFNTPVVSDITLYAVWGAHTHIVTFINGNWKLEQEVLNMQKLPYLSSVRDPVEKDENFSHWSLDEYGKPFDFSTPVSEDLTLYAVWKPIVTLVNGDEVSTIVFDYGTVFNNPGIPSVIPDGKTVFSHWSVEKDGKIEYVFGSPLIKDLTLYAVWKDYLVQIINLGNTISSFYVTKGTVLSEPDAPVEAGKEFLYWGTSDWGAEYDFSTPVTSNITLYAVYKNYKVHLINGSEEKIIPCYAGEELKLPEDPVAVDDWQGSFLYWSDADRNKGETDKIGTVIGEDITLYAIWMPKGVLYTSNAEGIVITDCSDAYKDSLTEIVVPYGVIAIGSHAFSWCQNITSVYLPDTVTSIEEGAFYECNSLLEINIPEGIECIADQTFSGCHALTSIELPDSVTSIGSDAFRFCKSLKNINIPENTASIGYWAFEGCSSLQFLQIPDTVTSIGPRAFKDCISLKSINIPNDVEVIQNDTFSNCTSLVNVYIGDGVTTIEERVFKDCTSLQLVVLPESLTSIGEEAFKNCSSLSNINIPSSVVEIGGRAFEKCISLSSISIPDSVTRIKPLTFFDCSKLTDISIPESVTSIGKSAFEGCSSLPSIILPSELESIEVSVFEDCSSLKSIDIPDGVNSIGHNAFKLCRSLENVTIPDSVIQIGSEAFYLTNLRNIRIPYSVEYIYNDSFYASGLNRIIIDNTENAISGSPWGATHATVRWLR